MPTIEWDKAGERIFETGVDHGVLYVAVDGEYPEGVAWNGLVTVTESPSGAEASPQYADNIKYLNLVSAEEFGGTIEAFMYPDAFEECDGTAEIAPGITIGQQSRKQFGLAYRTKVGNDTQGQDFAYKIHLIYGALAAPSEKAYGTVNDSPEAITLSWELTTTPVAVAGFKPTATLVIDSRTVDKAKLKALEDVLYGTDSAEARLPLPDEVKSLVGTGSVQSFSTLSAANRSMAYQDPELEGDANAADSTPVQTDTNVEDAPVTEDQSASEPNQ